MPHTVFPQSDNSLLNRFLGSWLMIAGCFFAAILTFAAMYALFMPESFYHANLKHEPQTRQNREKLRQLFQNKFRRPSPYTASNSFLITYAGLIPDYATTQVFIREIDDNGIAVELQIPASDRNRISTNNYGISVLLGIIDVPDKDTIEGFFKPRCLLTVRKSRFFGEGWGNASTNIDLLLLSDLFAINLESSVFLPSNPIEAELNSTFHFLPIDAEFEKQVKLCFLEASGRTSGALNSFLRMLYFSIVTIATLGYGDVTPITPWARFWSGFEVLVGLVLAGLFVSSFFKQFSKDRPSTERKQGGDSGDGDVLLPGIAELRQSLTSLDLIAQRNSECVDLLEEALKTNLNKLADSSAKREALDSKCELLDSKNSDLERQLKQTERESSVLRERIGELEVTIKRLSPPLHPASNGPTQGSS